MAWLPLFTVRHADAVIPDSALTDAQRRARYAPYLADSAGAPRYQHYTETNRRNASQFTIQFYALRPRDKSRRPAPIDSAFGRIGDVAAESEESNGRPVRPIQPR